MSQSGSFAGGINGNHYRLRVDWEAEQDIAGNYSTVTCRMYLEQDRYYSLNIGTRSNSTTIDGVALGYTSSAINNDGGTTVSLGTVSRTVPHEPDGSKTISLSSSFYINATIKGVKYNYINADGGSITLNTIPRKSTVSCPGEVNVDASLPITIGAHASSFRHTLIYQLAGGSVQTIDTGIGGGVYSWSTAGMASKITDSDRKTCVITCITYSGSTEIGRDTATCQVMVPDTDPYRPAISNIGTSDATHYSTTYGGYVQTKSRLRVVLSASGKEGSPIRSGTVTIGNTTLNGLDVTTDPLTGSGNVAVKAVVTDGRGHASAEKSRTIAVLPYSAPTVSRLSVERCTEAGTADEEGEYAMIRFEYRVSDLNGRNHGYITIQKSTEGAEEWSNVVENTQLSGYEGRYELKTPMTFDSNSAFDIRVSVHDDVTTSDLTLAALLPTAKTVFDILADGTGIAFGKVASKPNTLESAWDADVAGLSINAIKSNMIPDLDATYDIGNNSARYLNVHAIQAYLNSLEMCGNITSDTHATRDIGTSAKPFRYVYGNIGNFSSVYANGRNLCTNKVLWSGSYYMNGSQTATLSEAVSAQPHGIVLVFNAYYGFVTENAYNFFFIPKYFVTTSRGYSFFINEDVAWMAAKYLYISDTKITGHSVNATNSTSCGITFTNTNAVLRYVIGV